MVTSNIRRRLIINLKAAKQIGLTIPAECVGQERIGSSGEVRVKR